MDPRAILMGCAGLFLIGVFAVATAGAQLPIPRFGPFGRKPTAQATVALPGAASPGTVTATELWSIYNVDPTRADAMYKNRPVAVSGRVIDVRRDLKGDLLVRLATDQPFDTVRATVTNPNGLATIPSIGQTVALNCTGHGILIGAPILDACAPI
jgi:hypothetical protein